MTDFVLEHIRLRALYTTVSLAKILLFEQVLRTDATLSAQYPTLVRATSRYSRGNTVLPAYECKQRLWLITCLRGSAASGFAACHSPSVLPHSPVPWLVRHSMTYSPVTGDRMQDHAARNVHLSWLGYVVCPQLAVLIHPSNAAKDEQASGGLVPHGRSYEDLLVLLHTCSTDVYS